MLSQRIFRLASSLMGWSRNFLTDPREGGIGVRIVTVEQQVLPVRADRRPWPADLLVGVQSHETLPGEILARLHRQLSTLRVPSLPALEMLVQTRQPPRHPAGVALVKPGPQLREPFQHSLRRSPCPPRPWPPPETTASGPSAATRPQSKAETTSAGRYPHENTPRTPPNKKPPTTDRTPAHKTGGPAHGWPATPPPPPRDDQPGAPPPEPPRRDLSPR